MYKRPLKGDQQNITYLNELAINKECVPWKESWAAVEE